MISYGRHSVTQDDIDAVTQVLRGDWLTTGPLVEEFESALESEVGAPTVAVSSGTAALHSAYAAIGIGPGDEVITPPITFVATQATAALLGATPVFVDVKPDFPNIDPSQVERAITARTKAIVAVDYAGVPADLNELRAIADRNSLYLIEDAAHSLGSLYQGKPIGSIADLTTFSFYPTKNITTGEGGAISSNSPELLRKAREFSRQGLIRDRSRFRLEESGPWHQEVHEFGLNYRLPDILCALGISQLQRLHAFKLNRQELVNKYNIELNTISGLRIPSAPTQSSPMWHLYPLQVVAEHREGLFLTLRKAGVGVQVNYLPAYRHPAFSKFEGNPNMLPFADKFYKEEISLPLHPELKTEEQDFVIKIIRKYMENAS